MVVDVSDTTSSAEGTSKSVVNKYIIQTDKVSISAAEIDLLTSPVTLVATPGAGFFIQPITITCLVTWVSSGTSQSNYLYISYDSSSTINYIVAQRNFYQNESANRSYVFGAATASTDGTYAGLIADKPLKIYSNVDYTGDFTIDVYTTYQIVKV